MISVKRSSSGLEGSDHFFSSFFKEQCGQLRVKQRLELEGDIELHVAGVGGGAWGEPPDGLEVTEERPVSAHGLDLVVGDVAELRDVAFEDGGKSDLQLRTGLTASAPEGPRLFTPRDELTVLVHVGHDVIHLLRTVPHCPAFGVLYPAWADGGCQVDEASGGSDSGRDRSRRPAAQQGPTTAHVSDRSSFRVSSSQFGKISPRKVRHFL